MLIMFAVCNFRCIHYHVVSLTFLYSTLCQVLLSLDVRRGYADAQRPREPVSCLDSVSCDNSKSLITHHCNTFKRKNREEALKAMEEAEYCLTVRKYPVCMVLS